MAKAVTLETLGLLDQERAGAIVNQALAEAAADLDDRGEDGKPRKVQIEVSLQRREDGLVETQVNAKSVLPPRRTHPTITRCVRRGEETRLMFEPWSPENPDQRSLPIGEKE